MEVLIAVFSVVVIAVSVVGAIVGNIAANEIYEWCPIVARSIINRAVARLPEAIQERYREEWHAHLEECPTKLGKILHATGCYFGVRSISLRFVETEYRALVRELGLGALEPQVKEVFAALLPVLKKHYELSDDADTEILADEIEDVLSRYDEQDSEKAVDVYEKIIDYVQRRKS